MWTEKISSLEEADSSFDQGFQPFFVIFVIF